MIRLATILETENLVSNMSGANKIEIVDELLKVIARHEPDLDVAQVWEKILEREGIEDTSYGRGFAFPHARTDAVTKMHLAIGISKTGVKEPCRDGSKLHVFCLLLTPSNISKMYLQTLSALAMLARGEGNLEALCASETSEEILEVIWNSGVLVNREITVNDLMRHDPIYAKESYTLRDVANQLFRHRLSALPVVSDDKELLGHVTDRDLLTAALPDFRALAADAEFTPPEEPFEELLKRADTIDVSQLFQEDHVTVQPEQTIVRVSALMIANDLRRVYVVNAQNRLVGVLHRKDIVNMILRG